MVVPRLLGLKNRIPTARPETIVGSRLVRMVWSDSVRPGALLFQTHSQCHNPRTCLPFPFLSETALDYFFRRLTEHTDLA